MQKLENSVLYTDLLPHGETGNEFAASGLGGVAVREFTHNTTVWLHVNTDWMAPARQDVPLPPRHNVPTLSSAVEAPSPVPLDEASVAAVIDGFRETYRFLKNQRHTLLASDGPLAAFAEHPARYVFRSTRIYASIREPMLHPKYLRHGIDFSLYAERLARVHLLPPEKPHGWPILTAERRALLQGDIPYFTVPASETALLLPTGDSIPDYFTASSYDHVTARLAALDEADLAWQVDLARTALRARLPHAEPPNSRFSTPDVEKPSLDDCDAVLPDQALVMVETLVARAVSGSDGSATWIAPHYRPQLGRYHIAPLGLSLYDGLAGVALFLAAATKFEALSHARALSLAALHPVRAALQAPQFAATLAEWGLGGASGVGSMLYALLRAGQWLALPALIEEAQRAARRLTPAQIEASDTFDVTHGLAGMLLSLLAVYDATQDAEVLDHALAGGQRLLAARVPAAGDTWAWSTAGDQRLTGFAHGAAGIAYALLQLYAVTGETAFRTAARQAIAYESHVFVPAEGNWPDLRPLPNGDVPVPTRFGVAWCTGAAGIGLARLGALSQLDTAEIRRDIDVALATTQRVLAEQELYPDHLCCGNLGRVELLLTAGVRLQQPDLIVQARRAATRVLQRARPLGDSRFGNYRYTSRLPRGVYAPGFFQGAAGIGYALLRIAHPDQLPAILLWQ